MTHDELMAKYEKVAAIIRQYVESTLIVNWDFHNSEEIYYEVQVITPKCEEDGYAFEVYDRFDSPVDNSDGHLTSSEWVVLNPFDLDTVLKATTLEGVLAEAIVLGWFPGQPNPSI